ncbi:S-layer homology domain-containing protein [Paenibacillus macquariensis]|nr:S-layer homology domain-containing protein [Paenibacillus macquariensis]MEC0090461.1 S-layer homology domain-containing protein [Paenibacillus macquariensis]
MSFLLVALPVLQLVAGGNLAFAATETWTDITGSESFGNPSGVAIGSDGNVYVSDYGRAKVKQLSNGSWTDITGSESFNAIVGVAADSNGDVYVTDNSGRKVKKLSNGSWTDITGAGGFSNPVGIAADSNGNVYVTDSLSNKVKKLSNGIWTDITGAAVLSSPFGVAADNDGNVYVTNYNSNTIKKLSNGSWTDITGAGSFLSPFGVAVDSAGNVYVADSGNNKIKKLSNGSWMDITGAGSFSSPWGVIVDSSGNVYVTESGGKKIKKLSSPVINSVSVSPSSPSVVQGGSQQLTATVNAGEGAATTVTWSSSDVTNKVAVDSTGKVTVAADTAMEDYTIKATSTVDSSKTATATITVTAALTYTIAAITNPTLTALTQGYQSGTQETKNIEVTNTGTGNLPNLKVEVSGTNADDFAITQTSATLNSGAPATSFTVTANDGLAAGTYTATITISADNMIPVTLTVTQAVNLPDAPANPQNLVAVGEDRQVTLTWDTVTGATYYNIYMATASGQFSDDLVATVTHTTYNVQNLINGTAYYFMVKAGNLGGMSAESNQASVTPATVPAAPTNISAVAGNGQATVTFTAPADNGGSAVTGYEVTSSPGNVVVTGAVSPITLTGLTNGTSYTFTVKAINGIGKSVSSAESNAVIPRAESSSSSSTPSAPVTPTIPENTKTIVDIIVNGKVEGAGTATSTKRNGQTVTTVVVDQNMLSDKIAAEGQNVVITIAVKAKSDVVVVELNGQMVKKMESQQAVLEIKTDRATYRIPAQQLNMNAISGQVGKSVALQDIKVQIEIAATTADVLKMLENAAAKGEFTLVAPPMSFTVRGIYGDKTIEVSKFNAYVERTIAISDGVDPNMSTTGVVVEPDGNIRHVPTKIVVVDGKYFAKVNSLTNSTYLVIRRYPVNFADVAQHWSKDMVNDMASRMVVNGVDATHYNPDAAITRAEFAAIIVRALGLAESGKTSAFRDVKSGDWYVGAVAEAQEYGIIQGYEDGAFHPSDTITRQEAMAVIARAMKWTGLHASVNGAEAESALASFTDGSAVDAWAKPEVAAAVKNGLVKGSDIGLKPTNPITRAEVANMIQKLLQKSGLI